MDPRCALALARNIGEVNQPKKMIAELEQVRPIQKANNNKLIADPNLCSLIIQAKKDAAKASEPERQWIDLCKDDELPDIPTTVSIPTPS